MLFKESEKCVEFRAELGLLQDDLMSYTKVIVYMTGVEDLTEIENVL